MKFIDKLALIVVYTSVYGVIAFVIIGIRVINNFDQLMLGNHFGPKDYIVPFVLPLPIFLMLTIHIRKKYRYNQKKIDSKK